MMLACSEETRVLASRALVSLDISEAITRIDIPTLVIGGTADVLTPPAEARRIAKRIPNARLELVPGAGHMLMLEQTELIDRLIVEFAHEVQAPPRRAASSQ
jgi:pimeloyl-ACP methyl ester carboxylesterase